MRKDRFKDNKLRLPFYPVRCKDCGNLRPYRQHCPFCDEPGEPIKIEPADHVRGGIGICEDFSRK